jgi:hypothetical protein
VNTRRIPPIVRLMKRVVSVDGGCLLWLGAKTEKGYGRIGKTGGGTTGTHQVAWESVNGKVPDGLELDHTCRNRACVNVDHLEAVTHLENIKRGIRPQWYYDSLHGLRKKDRSHCVHGHEMSEKNIKWINGGKYKYCRRCFNEGRNRWRREKKERGV